MSEQRPVALPIRPRAGWRQAGPVHRALAAAALPLVLLDGVVLYTGLAWIYVFGLAATVVAFGAAARVIRPYPPDTRQIERRLRHGCSAIATTAGGSFFLFWLVMSLPGSIGDYTETGDLTTTDTMTNVVIASFYLWLLAALLGLITLTWGLVAVLVRAVMQGRSVAGGGPVGQHELTGGPDPAGGYGFVAVEQRP